MDNKNSFFLPTTSLNLRQTLFCGQSFRWTEISENRFGGFAGNRTIIMEQNKDGVLLSGTTAPDIPFWENYLDLSTDYPTLWERFSEDETLKKAVGYAKGIHILRQDPFEMLISFIISQNNNIPRISGIISRLCECFGEKNLTGYGFPSPETMNTLTEADLAPLRAGFRNRYIIDAAKRTFSREVDLQKIALLPDDEARAELMKIVGVGRKVADCVLLFGYNRLSVCPVDVWIKRVLEKYYPNGLPGCTKGYEGLAQQYLFQYERLAGKQE